MLTIHDPAGARLCDGLNRREWLRAGSVGLLGLSLPRLLQARQSEPAGDLGRAFARAKSVIVMCFLGGPSQYETWDPKPDAVPEVRGPFQPIATKTPGLNICELLPQTAQQTDKICLLRAMSTGDSAHSSSGYYMLTGRPHVPMQVENARPGAPNNWPSVGAIVRRLRPGNGALPASITLPEHIWNTGNIPWPGQDGGFLGRTADPWLIHCDPTARDFQISGLGLPDEVPPLRFDERRTLLEQVNHHLDSVDRQGAASQWNNQSQQAFDLLRGAAARRAFDLNQEPLTMRERYGMHRFGQSCLLARRLVEAGVALVQVNWNRTKDPKEPNDGMWDTHAKHNEASKTYLSPPMDRAYAALLEDLHERGLLEQTLVVWMGEFGRTPKYNAAGGRDHWGHVFSVALAGGGVRGGQVIGCSDRNGAYPKDGKVTPPDLAATIFHCLGLGPEAEIRDTLGRPIAITSGQVIRQAF
jgi:hypothetical protein